MQVYGREKCVPAIQLKEHEDLARTKQNKTLNIKKTVNSIKNSRSESWDGRGLEEMEIGKGCKHSAHG